MDMCFICFSDAPVEDDPRAGHANKWQIVMKEAPGADAPGFLYGCCCIPCAQYQLRSMALEGDLSKNKCCMGYVKCCGAENRGGEQPQFCLCLEVCCCPGCAVSGTRAYIMDSRNIVSDPCDNRIIRFNNCMQLFSCILNIAAIFIEGLDDAADVIDLIADLVFMVTAGCMYSQMKYELTHVNNQPIATGSPIAPVMER